MTSLSEEFSTVLNALKFIEEMPRTVDLEEHFWTLIQDKRLDSNLLLEMLLGAGFKDAVYFEKMIEEKDIDAYCTGVYFTREFAPELKMALMQERIFFFFFMRVFIL